MNDPKLNSPSFHRNVQPIVNLLTHLLPDTPLTWLEIGSGSGQHVTRFAREFLQCEFQPTEIEPENIQSIDAWVQEATLKNVQPAKHLDVTAEDWPFNTNDYFDIISAFNVIHIAPPRVTGEIFRGAHKHGSEGCRLFFYGPFKMNGGHTSESNADFELWLKEKSPDFGIWDIDQVDLLAQNHGFECKHKHKMPANNFMMEFGRITA